MTKINCDSEMALLCLGLTKWIADQNVIWDHDKLYLYRY